MKLKYNRPEFSGPGELRTLLFPLDGEWLDEPLLVTSLGNGLWVLEESPVFSDEVSYHDTIELEALPNRDLRFLRLVVPSGLRHLRTTISQSFIDSPEWARLQQRIHDVGGQWERVFGGMLIVHTRPEVFDQIANTVRESRLAVLAREKGAIALPKTIRKVADRVLNQSGGTEYNYQRSLRRLVGWLEKNHLTVRPQHDEAAFAALSPEIIRSEYGKLRLTAPVTEPRGEETTDASSNSLDRFEAVILPSLFAAATTVFSPVRVVTSNGTILLLAVRSQPDAVNGIAYEWDRPSHSWEEYRESRADQGWLLSLTDFTGMDRDAKLRYLEPERWLDPAIVTYIGYRYVLSGFHDEDGYLPEDEDGRLAELIFGRFPRLLNKALRARFPNARVELEYVDAIELRVEPWEAADAVQEFIDGIEEDCMDRAMRGEDTDQPFFMFTF